MERRIPFMSLVPGPDAADVRAAIERVIARGWFILGPEVEAFEAEFARASGAAYAVGVGTGTDAIALALRALGIGPGDEVITSALSATYSALAIMMTGARPVFADVDPDRLTIDPASIERAIGPRTRAIVPVHLYGQAAAMNAISRIAASARLTIVEDCCQAHLATSDGRPVGTIGAAGAFSFYPTKNLGALGDAGAIVTNDPDIAARVKRLRNGGQTDRYHHQEPGVNSRLDDMQAAILRARLPRVPQWTQRRRALAAKYRHALAGVASSAGAGLVIPPEFDSGHVYHLFVIRSAWRNELQTRLASRGVETLIHYPVPIPRQPALSTTNPADCPIAARVCDEVLSLPLHPGLRDEDADIVATTLIQALETPGTKGHNACVH